MQTMTTTEYKKHIKKRKPLSEDFLWALNMMDRDLIMSCETEYRFHPTRKWRFDFAWPDKKVAVECDGMVWQAGGGRHNTDADREKINTAVMMGWRVLRFSGAQIKNDPVGCVGKLKQILLIKNK